MSIQRVPKILFKETRSNAALKTENGMQIVRELMLSYVFFDKLAPLHHKSQTKLFPEV